MHVSLWIQLMVITIAWSGIFVTTTFAATNTDTQNASKIRIAAENAFSQGDMKSAISILSKLIELEPQNERNYYKRYRAYLSERKYTHALSDLTASLRVNPKYKQGLIQRGKLYMILGQCGDAVHDFEQLSAYYPSETSAMASLEKSRQCAMYINEAERAQSRGDFSSAYNHLTTVIEETASSSITLLRERAQLSISLQNPYDAIADLGTVLKLDSSNLPALLMRGEVFYTLGDKRSLEAALSHYREGLHSDPEHKGLKVLYRKLKKILKYMTNGSDAMERQAFVEAVEAWQSALKIDPTHTAMNKDVWFQLCQCEIRLHQYNNAVNACNHVIQAEDDHGDAHVKLSEALLGLEQYEEAVRHARRAYDIDNSNQMYQEAVHKAEAALKQSKEKNYYKILGVSRTAHSKEIKKAYRKQALEWHPDKHTDKEESEREQIQKKFHDIAEAYEILSNEEMRAKYDRGEDVTGNGQQQHHHHQRQHHHQFFQQGGRTFHFTF